MIFTLVRIRNECSKTTILIVDDTPTNIQLLNSMLREQYKVKAATNGAKALKIAR